MHKFGSFLLWVIAMMVRDDRLNDFFPSTSRAFLRVPLILVVIPETVEHALKLAGAGATKEARRIALFEGASELEEALADMAGRPPL
jgi:hypothetical protein